MDNFRIPRTISNFLGQFLILEDNFDFSRTILKFEKFGGQSWKFVDNCPRTIVVHGQLSTEVPRPKLYLI
jgi:hypothetical protein